MPKARRAAPCSDVHLGPAGTTIAVWFQPGIREISSVIVVMRVAWVLAGALLAAAPARAISVHDVVQLSRKGYSDRQIVDLMNATDSAFRLEAADLPRLKEQGLSEAVIRAMLERSASGTSDASPRAGAVDVPTEEAPIHRTVPTVSTSAGAAADRPHEHAAEAEGIAEADAAELRGRGDDGAGATSAARVKVSHGAFREEGAGSHAHVAVALSGIEVLVLRDEGGHPSTEARARDIVARLNEARDLGGGTFRVRDTGSEPALLFEAASTERQVPILAVSVADAAAFAKRSPRHVTPDVLAHYWAALLNDYWALAVLERAPSALIALHEADALTELYEELSAGRSGGFESAAGRLGSSMLHHLRILATSVPEGFGGTLSP